MTKTPESQAPENQAHLPSAQTDPGAHAMPANPHHLSALHHSGHADIDLDPVALAHAILADSQVAASVLAQLKCSHVLVQLALYGDDPRAVVFAAGEVSQHLVAVRVAAACEAVRLEFQAANPPEAMAPEKTGALKMRVILSKK